jgi:transcriptional regulator with XRE-family HTH domain
LPGIGKDGIIMFDKIKEYDADVQFEIGQRIQALRMSKGIAAVELASFLNIGRNQMSRIENGRANCTLQQMFLLAQILECSVDYLMFGKKEKQQFSSKQMEAVQNMIKAFAM